MALTTKGIFIVGAKRTPFCKYGGYLRELPASHAFAAAAEDALQSANIDPALVDATVVGNVNFLSQCDGGKTSRYCGLYSGVPIDRPCLAVNKACGTGLQAIINGALDIIIGPASITLTGGTENMSSLPLLVRNIRFGTILGASYQLEEYISKQALDTYTGLTLQKMADHLAKKYGIKRQEVDEYTAESRVKWKKAQEDGLFQKEITPLTVNTKKKQIVVDKDEILEDFDEMSGVDENVEITSSCNSSPPADGASAIIIASTDALAAHNLTPLARVAAWTCVGVDPSETGVGAVVAVRKLLDMARVEVDDVDLFEINETFAAQALVSAKELKVARQKLNVHGGALAVGNPVAATGARMVTHLVQEMRRQNLKSAIAASSCGGGQGIALLLEKI